ncbi:aldehyde dehydrogenase family protein [Algoriphagus sp. CAU 1675]|uniref:aldehyde dehydrogenase family protein n=1 Tax=Algoriphagus sp. CAU 1675 TaxID=3032597 RepID=UPI0023DC2653|nr:aldehyde dehydrogenase family protein [Algoriphagus sp. CAU 1675]
MVEIQEIFNRQKKTAENWRSSRAEERIERIKKIRTWIKSHQKEIRKSLWEDFKKPEIETDLSEIFPVTSEINHTIKNLKSWMKPRSLKTPMPMLGTKAQITFEPKGRALIISPWNYPFNLAIGPLISALAAGCPAIIKPSEISPFTSELLEKMISELFDPNEVAVIRGESSTAQELLSLPFDHIFFTGSPHVGKIVMRHAAEHLSSVTLELGGKSPAIIDKSANIQDAAEKVIWGKMVNCGQTCIAPDYILVHQEVKDILLAELKVAIQKMYDPIYKGLEYSQDLARIVNERHYHRLTKYLEDALEKGAKLEFGGGSNPHHRFIEPTILSEINESMLVAHEEIFGPILPVITFDSTESAISYINAKPKPLALYAFGGNKNFTDQVLQRCSSGNALTNDCVLHFLHNELPFGGVNNSGIGKAHGQYGFLAFSNEKGVLHQRTGYNNTTLLRPPYGAKAKQIVASLIKWF